MKTHEAVRILLQSGFQVTKNNKAIVYASLMPRKHTAHVIKEAIMTLNQKKDYAFIEEITDTTNPIL